MDVGLLLDIVAASDVGLQRSNNEDAFLVLEAEKLCVVADGMGGHLGGEVASSMVTEILREAFTAPPAEYEAVEVILERLLGAIQLANREIYNRGNSDPRLRNMGTTVVSTLFHGTKVIFASVGDSRIYRLRDGVLKQITEDHSWVGELRKKNLISEEDARNHPLKNIITRALGMEEDVDVDGTWEETQSGDVYLLCTDGLTDLVEDGQIQETLKRLVNDLDEAVNALLDCANDEGGADNITVGLCKVIAP